MSRVLHEIEHGKKICRNAEQIWGWSTPAGKMRAARRGGYILSLGGFNAAMKLLELGCGTGLFTQMVYDTTGADITAIDVSDELLDKAKLRLPEVCFKTEDAMNMPFEENSFDAVYGSSVIHHLEIERALKEIFRVLKPGGRMIFAEPNMLNPQIFIERNVRFVKKWLGVSPDETAVNRWNMKKLLDIAGFKNSRVFAYDFLHPHTPVFLIGPVKKLGGFCEKIPLVKEIAGSVIIYAVKPADIII